jgi:hypothetical protein
MLVTSSLDSIDLILSSSVSTNQLQVSAHYNALTATTATPVSNFTISNGTSSINIVPSPAIDTQHQLKYCNIFNSDSSNATITIRGNYNGTNRNVFSTILQVNEYVQYTQKSGWKCFDKDGSLKTENNDIVVNVPIIPPFSLTVNTGTGTSITTTQCVYMGKATRNHKNILLSILVATAAVGATWVEAAVYKGTPNLGSSTTITRCGSVNWLNLAQIGTGGRGVYIPVSGINAGDDLWAVFGQQGGTTMQIRANTIVDNVAAGFVMLAGTSRPSLSASLSPTLASATTPVRFTWMGD